MILEDDRDQEQIIRFKSDREKILEEWSKDFISDEAKEKQSWKTEELAKLTKERKSLSAIKDLIGLNEEKGERLKQLNDFVANKYKLDKEGKKIDLKIRGADTTHILFSVGGKENVRTAQFAFRRFLNENFKSAGFRYVFATHNDTDNLHFHLVANNRNILDKDKKLHFDKGDLFVLRREFAKHLKSMGIGRESTLRKDRNLDQIIQKETFLKERKTWYQSKIITGEENRNSYVAKSSILKQTQSLIKYVDSRKQYEPKEARKLHKLHRNLIKIKKEMSKISINEFSRLKDDMLKSFDNTDKAIIKKIENINLPTEFAKKKNRKAIIKDMVKKQNSDLKNAREFLIDNFKTSNDKERAELADALDSINDLLKKTKSKGLGF